MLSGSTKYIMDANAIRSIRYDLINSKKRSDRLIITISDVKNEVASLKKLELISVENLSKDAYIKMAEIINNNQKVRNIINYVDNKGAADIGLLSYALTIDDGKLCHDDIFIVTNDVGLRLACDDLCVKWMSVEDFIRI